MRAATKKRSTWPIADGGLVFISHFFTHRKLGGERVEAFSKPTAVSVCGSARLELQLQLITVQSTFLLYFRRSPPLFGSFMNMYFIFVPLLQMSLWDLRKGRPAFTFAPKDADRKGEAGLRALIPTCFQTLFESKRVMQIGCTGIHAPPTRVDLSRPTKTRRPPALCLFVLFVFAHALCGRDRHNPNGYSARATARSTVLVEQATSLLYSKVLFFARATRNKSQTRGCSASADDLLFWVSTPSYQNKNTNRKQEKMLICLANHRRTVLHSSFDLTLVCLLQYSLLV